MGWLTSWLLNPWLLGAGALAMLSPIIIHLLNRRRFKIVDWAAMRFLLDADKKNRKRVKLENLILLMLRCLAMLLLGIMIARPFLPSAVGQLLGNEQRFERVIVLDDSLSQQVVVENQSQFERSQESLKDMLGQIALDDKEDFFTLYLTSRPTKPVLSNEPVTPDTVASLTQAIGDLKCSDRQALYEDTLQEVQRYVGSERDEINRLVYVMSDLRKSDWVTPEKLAAENSPNKLIAAISENVTQCSVVDTGSVPESNLAILDIRPQDMLVANTVVRFNVTVGNLGDKTVNNLQVKFYEGENSALTETIASLGPDQTEVVTFRYLFQHEMDDYEDMDLQALLTSNRLNYRISAELLDDGTVVDHLKSDSSHYFAARVLQGIPILVVDGEPSPIPERSETVFLKQIGVDGTGLLVDTVTVSELEDISLSKYKVIFLCNIDEASADRVTSLKQWVSNGGGLVFMPGGVCNTNRFNESFFEAGQGLSPLKLIGENGDPTMARWVNFEVTDPNHSALRVAQDQDVDLGKVEIFSWWDTGVAPEQMDKTVSVILRLSNDTNSPAMAEKTFGKGRVVTFSVPADGDWTMWPVHPTYVCVMWDLVNYLAVGAGEVSSVTVGNSVSYPVDLSLYDLQVGMTGPEQDKIETSAVPLDETEEGKQSVIYQANFDPLESSGFYQMNLRKTDGDDDPVLFSANVDTFESDLSRVDVTSLESDFFGEETALITTGELSGKVDSNSRSGIWPKVLIGLLIVLCAEQFLGWFFGRKR